MEFGALKNRVKPFGLFGFEANLPGGAEISDDHIAQMKAALGIEKGSDLEKIIDGEYELQGALGHIEDLAAKIEETKSNIEDEIIDSLFSEEQQQSVQEVLDEIEEEIAILQDEISNNGTEAFAGYDE